jgi:hypothetical protein
MAERQFHAYSNKSQESITSYHFHGQTQVPVSQARKRLWSISPSVRLTPASFVNSPPTFTALRRPSERKTIGMLQRHIMRGMRLIHSVYFSHCPLMTRRNPDVREKNRLNMQARRYTVFYSTLRFSPSHNLRATAKALRRQWDPPKPNRAIQDMPRSDSERGSGAGDLEMVSGERLRGRIHFHDPRGATTSSDEDSQFRQVELQRRVPTESSEVPMVSGSAEPTPKERIAAAVLTAMGGGHIGGSQDSVKRCTGVQP